MNDMHTYPYKYGELTVLARQLAEFVKGDYMSRIDRDGCAPYTETITYDKAKRVLKLLEDHANRRAS